MIKKRFFFMILFIFNFIFLGFNYNIPIHAQEEVIQTTSFIHCAGRSSSLLLSNQGVVYGWGLWGEGSNVSLSKKLLTPTDISKNIELEKEDSFINTFSGEQHSFILSEKGRVFAMGSGEKKQLGYSDYIFKSNPIELTQMFPLKDNEKITYIGCGDDFNIALTNTHRVISFGKNEDGQLGIESQTKEEVTYDITSRFTLQEGDYIVDVQCGASHSLALSKNGYIYVWGSNKFGQLGIKDVEMLDIPTQLESINEAVNKIAVGRFTSYVLTNQAQLYGFGSDSYGQLATHDPILSSNMKKTPYLMNSGFSFENDEYIKDIIAGYYFAIVKTNYSTYYSFGQNSSGQLANNSTLSTSIPQKIEYKPILSSLDEIVSISCGQDHCIASTKYGHILAWGSNLQGQLSEDQNISQANYKITDITYNFPPVIVISTNSSSVEYKNYVLDIEAFYLDKEEIKETYYCISSSLLTPTENWVQFKDHIIINDVEGQVYVHLKIDSKKETYYHVSKPLFLDHLAPTIQLKNEKNEEILTKYYNSTIFVDAIDNNNSVDIVYTHNGEQYTIHTNTLSLNLDGKYVVYAMDDAKNTSATIEFTIDTILPTITKIDDKLISGTSYSTREKEITIKGSEALTCYLLGYKGVKDNSYIALNENENEFKIKLKKGVNTLIICDLAGNESLTYEIIYSPRFFQDTQLLLIVFSSIAIVFVFLIVLVYVIKNKKNLLK